MGNNRKVSRKKSGKGLQSRLGVTNNDSINSSLTNKANRIQDGIKLTLCGAGAVTEPTADPTPRRRRQVWREDSPTSRSIQLQRAVRVEAMRGRDGGRYLRYVFQGQLQL